MKDKIERIKNLMAELNINQTELAKLSNISFATLNRILNGKQELKPNTLHKIAGGLSISVAELECRDLSFGTVQGYLQYKNEITHITSYGSLLNWIKKYGPLVNGLSVEENETTKNICNDTVVMFDMDFTLVDSSISTNLTWQEKKKHIPKYIVYDGIIDLINNLKEQNVDIWCVSGNVGSVVKETLTYHNIPIDINKVSAYKHLMSTDNLKRKIAVIKNALKKIDSTNIYYVADEADDVEACRQLGITCILAMWNGTNIHIDGVPTASEPMDVFDMLIKK